VVGCSSYLPRRQRQRGHRGDVDAPPTFPEGSANEAIAATFDVADPKIPFDSFDWKGEATP
jgi:hypothetical protein